MLIFDQLKHDDRKLRVISIGVMIGLLVLFSGLWWVQIVSAKRYEENLKNQSFRTVRVPALRGKILDRNGESLAENRARFDINLYLEDLRSQFTYEYTNRVVPEYVRRHPEFLKPVKQSVFKRFFASVAEIFGAEPKAPPKATARLPLAIRTELESEARYRVVSNITAQVTTKLEQPVILDPVAFNRHYFQKRYIPMPILQNLTPKQVAIFAEQFTGVNGVEMEIQPTRVYPRENTAAHLLGYIRRNDKPDADDEINYKYYLPDFVGVTGVEASFDGPLRGKAGIKSLLVNNIGYRQREDMLSLTEPGKNLVLTIDYRIQKAAEEALATAMAKVRGAVVVMDVRNGDVLALVSAPAFDPNAFPTGVSTTEWARLNNENYSYMFNRATYGYYPPGSILKIITAIACFENNVMSPSDTIYNPGFYRNPKVTGRRDIDDTAPPGTYDFRRAFIKSSNTYFIHFGLQAGFQKLIEVSQRFHLGEETGLLPREEVPGQFPSLEDSRYWTPGRVANLCIGQEVTTTPIQIASFLSAIANGGKLYWPRLIRSLQSPDEPLPPTAFSPGSLRADAKLNPYHLKIIQQAMLADVEDPDGSGHSARVEGFKIAGKTGTAEGTKEKTTWFACYGPFENPRYAVIVMVQAGASGGGTCAPVAAKIFRAIQKIEQTPVISAGTIAMTE